MKNVSILVPESAVMQGIADPQYLFSAVNQFLNIAGRPALFKVELVGEKEDVKVNDGMYSVHTDRRLRNVKKNRLGFNSSIGWRYENSHWEK